MSVGSEGEKRKYGRCEYGIRRKINNINNALLKELDSDNIISKIRRIEEIAYEGRKI